tara:strand:- start:10758 stop:12776 length:2019 start_codon:yes stop_codon:yes gene_type:complete
MCGIFGISIKANNQINSDKLKKLTKNFIKLSERRGKDASGFVTIHKNKINILKSPNAASNLMREKKFAEILNNAICSYKNGSNFVVCGHTRMVTSGTEYNNNNNQPVIKSDNLLIHNGIIVNESDIYRKNKSIKKEYEVDSEVMLNLFNVNNKTSNNVFAFNESVKTISGANTFVLIDNCNDDVFLYSSNKSLYIFHNENLGYTFYCSEKEMLQNALRILSSLSIEISSSSLISPSEKEFFKLNLNSNKLENYKIGILKNFDLIKNNKDLKHKQINLHNIKLGYNILNKSNEIDKIAKALNTKEDCINEIKRCAKCILPETFPSISFDENNVCNFCRFHQKNIFLGEKRLFNDAESLKNTNSHNDVLVPLSGGRDSCFGLHYVTKELGLNPVAYTYDWGFVTDHARKNISRICGELNVEHIIIAANIRDKRANVKKNVEAWLKKPEISLVPLFMAGDKFFYKYASLLKKEMKLSSIIFSLHALEVTHFKTGFANVNQNNQNDWHQQLYGLSAANRIKLMFHYFTKFMSNPRYINSTIPDTLRAFFYYYMRKKDYFSIFDYLEWDEDLIVNTIMDNYEWQGSNSNSNSWRIGDGTAPFYNYIYLRHSGFCENDTFRSNQIREGLIDRKTAITLIKKDNQIDVNAFKWYCDTIDVDALNAINSINSHFNIEKVL